MVFKRILLEKLSKDYEEGVYLLEAGDGVHELDIQLGVVLSQ